MNIQESTDLGLTLSRAHHNDSRGDFLHPLHAESVDLCEAISRHYVYGSHPGEIITKRRPSEPEELRKYREDVYEQITFSIANKIVGVQRSFLFNENLYHVDYPENEAILKENGLREYVENLPFIGDIFEYFQEFVLQFSNVDPNGYFVVIPSNYTSQDLSEFLSPIPEYIPCKNVLSRGSDFVFVKSTQKTEKDGEIYYLFSDNQTIRFEYTGQHEANMPIFDAVLVHEHNWGKPMARQISGIVSTRQGASVLDEQGQTFFLSHVTPTVPHLNNILKDTSDLNGAIVNHLYPPKYEGSIDCPTCSGSGETYTSTGDKQKCGTCKGSETVGISQLAAGTGPFVGYVVEPDEKGNVNIPAGYITNADVISAIEKASQIIKEEERKAYASVNMEFIFDTSARQKTEKEVKEDSKLFEAFLIQSAKTVFPLCQWILDAINWSRYSVILGENRERIKENRIVISAPGSFDVTNTNAALERIKLSIEAKIDNSIIHELIKYTVPKLFVNAPAAARKASIIAKLDPFPMMNADDILAMQAAGAVIDPVDVQLKSKLSKLVGTAISNDPGFVELNTDEQRQVLIQLLTNDR